MTAEAFSAILPPMKTKIESLREHLGSFHNVAEVLGITERQLLNVRKGISNKKSLNLLIDRVYETLVPSGTEKAEK